MKKIKIILFFAILISTLFLLFFGSNFFFYRNHIWYQYPNEALPISYREVFPLQSPMRSYLSVIPSNKYNGKIPFERQNDKETAEYYINEYGMFSYKNIKKINPETYKILWLGGSGAQGHGASRPEKIAANLLEKKLNAIQNKKPKKIEVFNFAMAGHTSDDNLFVFYTTAEKIKPSLIIFYAGANDLAHMVFINLNKSLEKQADSILNNEFLFNNDLKISTWVKKTSIWFPLLGKKYKVFLKIHNFLNPKKTKQNLDIIKKTLLLNSNLVESTEEAGNVLNLIDEKRTSKTQSSHRERTKNENIGRALLENLAAENFCRNILLIEKISGATIIIIKQAINSDNKMLYDNWFDIDSVYDEFFAIFLSRMKQENLLGTKVFFCDGDKILHLKSNGDYWARHIHLNDAGQENLAQIVTDFVINKKIIY